MKLFKVKFQEWQPNYYVVAESAETVAEVATQRLGDQGLPPTIESMVLIAGEYEKRLPELVTNCGRIE